MAGDAAAEEEGAGWPSEKGSYPVFPANVVVVLRQKRRNDRMIWGVEDGMREHHISDSFLGWFCSP